MVWPHSRFQISSGPGSAATQRRSSGCWLWKGSTPWWVVPQLPFSRVCLRSVCWWWFVRWTVSSRPGYWKSGCLKSSLLIAIRPEPGVVSIGWSTRYWGLIRFWDWSWRCVPAGCPWGSVLRWGTRTEDNGFRDSEIWGEIRRSAVFRRSLSLPGFQSLGSFPAARTSPGCWRWRCTWFWMRSKPWFILSINPAFAFIK